MSVNNYNIAKINTVKIDLRNTYEIIFYLMKKISS